MLLYSTNCFAESSEQRKACPVGLHTIVQKANTFSARVEHLI